MTGITAKLNNNNKIVLNIEITYVHNCGFMQTNEPDELLCISDTNFCFSPVSWKKVNVSAIHLFLPVGSSCRN